MTSMGMTLWLASLALVPPGFALTKKKFDFVVGVNGDFKAAMAAASQSASAANRFVIFFPDGEYNIGGLTGNANQMTTFTTSNVSFVGQSEDKTVIYNKSKDEGISITATLYFNKANSIYLQDLSIMNRANYGDPSTYNVTGRHVAVMEQGNQFVYKNVRLLSTQDTYYTKGTRTYWEHGQIHGTTDFICGDGDVFFKGVQLYEMKKSAMVAPQTSTNWGYVFDECVIDGDVTDFNLGRSWGTARAVFLRTTMKKLPAAAGWGDPMNSNPKVFAEYKSVTSSGSLIDLGNRRKSYTKDGVTVNLNPVLSDAEAGKYTVAGVLGGSDNWQPQNLTKQVAAPVLKQEGSKLTWNDDADALGWVIFKNGKYQANVITPSVDAGSVAVGDMVTVRAANAMGGLGAASNAVKVAAPTGLVSSERGSVRRLSRSHQVVGFSGFGMSPVTIFIGNLAGNVLGRISDAALGADGAVDLAPLALSPGFYIATATASGHAAQVVKIQIVD